jgi:predicted AAA+ superfamily ATPase
VEGYLEILEDLLLGFRIPVFSKRAKRHLVAHEKFYYFDTGVFRSVRPKGPLDRPEEIEGMALEGLVAQHLRAWCAYRQGDNRLHYWRTKAGNEVDFVVYGEETFTAIEVKRTTRINNKDLSGLKAFREDYPEANIGVLYLGNERLTINGIPCVPLQPFLEGLHPERRISFGPTPI